MTPDAGAAVPPPALPGEGRGPSSGHHGQVGGAPTLDPGLRRGERSRGATRLGLSAYLLALAVIVLDQLSKLWVLRGLFPSRCPGFAANAHDLVSGCSVDLLPVLSLTMVWNRGVSFNLLQAHQDWGRWGLAVFSAAVVLALALWARKAQRPVLAVALGLVIGGAAGNLIDRVRLGAVADFINVSGLGFFPWVFNLADSAISVGVLLLVLDNLRPHYGRPSSPPAAAARTS